MFYAAMNELLHVLFKFLFYFVKDTLSGAKSCFVRFEERKKIELHK